MKKYKVDKMAYAEDIKKFHEGDIASISSHIKIGSEIIEEENGTDKLIGVVTPKTLVVFSLHLFERARKHLCNTSEYIDQFITDVKKWIYEDIPMIQEDNLFYSKEFYGSDNHKDILNEFVRDIIHIIKGIIYVSYCDVYIISPFYIDIYNKEKVLEEYREQGQFIIDFLKSNDYLFCL